MELLTERHFSMSAFEALRNIRKYRSAYAHLDKLEILRLIQAVEIGALDYEAALLLDNFIPNTDGMSDVDFLRNCIKVVLTCNPIWIRSVSLGRAKFVQKLERDQSSCFRCARLMDKPAPDDVEGWWAEIMAYSRANSEAGRADQGRRAEKMSLEFERRRLLGLGIAEAPTWMSLEDNTVGYDIVSYDRGQPEPRNLLIEVKSFITSGEFFLTRNEWHTASKYRDRYQFQIWDMTERRLYRMDVDEVGLHVPTDAEGGQWENATISIPTQHPFYDATEFFVASATSSESQNTI